jgi:hypothetical protein
MESRLGAGESETASCPLGMALIKACLLRLPGQGVRDDLAKTSGRGQPGKETRRAQLPRGEASW